MAAETTNRRWWATLGTGAAVCLGCCLVPPLIAAGILGSGSVLVSLSWLEPLGFTLLGLGAAGLVWTRLRTRRNGCGTDGSAVGSSCASTGCGCASTPAAGSGT
ncbi:hypothetical protein ACWEVD_01395 [Nocardia thailandica]